VLPLPQGDGEQVETADSSSVSHQGTALRLHRL